MPPSSYHYQEIVLDSGDYKHGDKNVPHFQFDQDIDNSEFFQVHRVSVPTTYYVFDETSNSFTLDGTTTGNHLITWPPGNYTAEEWVNLMTVVLGDHGIDVEYSSITNKLTFFSIAVFGFNIQFKNSTPSSNGYAELGFAHNVLYESVNYIVTHRIEAPFAAQFSGPNFMYLRSNMASVFNNEDLFFSNTTVTSTGGDILAMVPIDQNRNSVVFYVDQSNHMIPWRSRTNKRINMYFTLGRRTKPLDFNGHSFQVRLQGYMEKETSPYTFND